MPRMLKELYRRPELGFLHAEMWFSRTIILLQYWRTTEHLLADSKSWRKYLVDGLSTVRRQTW
jgi:hypothetical protein